jgi:hypothetical protein
LIANGAAEFDAYPGNKIAFPQYAGAGKLDLQGSLQAGLTAVPSTVNFAPLAETVSVANVGSSADTFSVVVNSIDGVATPSVDSSSFSLAPGASKTITIALPAALASGRYHGFAVVSGSRGQTPLRLPYWYGVAGPVASALSLYVPSVDAPSCTDYIDFRLLDASGMPVASAGTPSVTTTSPQASVVGVYPVSDYNGDDVAGNYIGGTFEAQITTGRPDLNGNNVFSISSGSFNATVTVSIDTSGATSCNFSTPARVPVTGLRERISQARKPGSKKPE